MGWCVVFDEATRADLFNALRLLEGQLRGRGEQLSPGAKWLLDACSVPFGSVQCTGGDNASAVLDDAAMALLDAADVAARLRIPESRAKKLMRDREIPVVHVGRFPRVRPEDLDDYIAGLPTEAVAS